MSQNVITKLKNNVDIAEKRLADLRYKLDVVKKFKIEQEIAKLSKENQGLNVQVERARNELIRLETLNGKKQYPIQSKTILTAAVQETPTENEPAPAVKTIKEKKEKLCKSKEQPKQAGASDTTVDVRKLDFRIGKIIEINKHPDADSLYVEKIDCGEEKPRTVVSGLVNYVPIEEMRDRMVMVLCNLKPVKMRGVTSEAMVMCASTPEKVEVLIPPNSAVPGDLVTCEGYPREPEAQLNPKKKIFETCAPDLKTNDDKVACYKDSSLLVVGKGPITAPTLKGVNVK